MNDDQLLRYSRHILLDEVNVEGQATWLNSRVLIVGLGGLGSPAALYLAAAGIGHLLLMDHDRVELANLQRQIIHQYSAIDQYKVASAKYQLTALSPQSRIDAITQAATMETLTQVLDDQTVDVVVDCSDNFDTRFAINQACVDHRVALVSGAAIRWQGQVAVFSARDAASPCYRCLYQSPSDESRCADRGVIGPLVGIVGSYQALEVLRLLHPFGQSQVGVLSQFDGLNGGWRKFKLNKDLHCSVCRF